MIIHDSDHLLSPVFSVTFSVIIQWSGIGLVILRTINSDIFLGENCDRIGFAKIEIGILLNFDIAIS